MHPLEVSMQFEFLRSIGKVAVLSAAALAMASGSALAQQGGAFTIQIDGSSTVFPISEAVAEGFQQTTQGRIRVTVGESGTGGGFRKFCRGEIHISDASRPIRASEMATCAAAGIQYVEVPVAFDGIAVVVHPSNPMRSITTAQLRQIWQPSSQGRVSNFNQASPSFPNLAMQLYGPGSASGTFEYFTEAVNGTARASRTDYTPSEDDNVIVQGVANNPGGMGYFGLAYYEENRSRLRALSIDNGNGAVEPSVATVANGTYAPLSRPLFIYINAAALRRPQVMQFAQYYVNNAAAVSARVGYIQLPAAVYPTYLQRVQRRTPGTAFAGRSVIGATIEQVVARRLVQTPVSE
jgi:phosphate transport system substrate-binding protein